MYESILVPLDGSPFGEAALPAAIALARRTGARLHLVHVRPVASWTGISGLASAGSGRIQDEMSRYLDGIVDQTSDELGESVSFSLLDGPVPDAIREYAAARHISVIVMSTHGRRGLSRAWLGSVAAGVVRESPAPVLLVRPRKSGARPGANLRIRRILVPLDGSELSATIVPHAAALARITGAAVQLVHVIEPVFRVGEAILVPAVEYDAEAHERHQLESRGYLERIAARLSGEGLAVETRVVSGEAVQTLLDQARETGADLIALATHGRSGWQRLAFGSVADKIVRSSTLPVLAIRPPRPQS